MHVLIPKEWKTSGGIVWEQKAATCGKNPTRFEWRATSPDGTSVIEILPEETWGGNNLGMPPQGPCPNVWIRSAKEYLQAYVQNNRPGARIRSYRDREDISKEYQHLNQTQKMPMGELRNWVDTGEVILDYEINGQAYEEVLAIMAAFSLNRMQGVMPGEVREFLTVSTVPGFSMRTPRGKLNLKLAEAVRSSAKPNQEWSNLMAEHNMKMNAIAMKGARDRHAIHMKSQREIAAIHQKSYKNTQAAIDRGNDKFNQMIRGVETYKDPGASAPVELPYTHDNAWKLDDDTYILTDDANFEPYRDLGIAGRQLERAP